MKSRITKPAAKWAGAALLLAGACAAQAAGYEPLGREGPVLKACNPNGQPDKARCLAHGLPGVDDMDLVATASQPIVVNEVTVGQLTEQVWQSREDAHLYVFGLRVQLNSEAWDASGRSFNINDVMRRTLNKETVRVAYDPDGAVKPLLRAGRTSKGLAEYEDGRHPKRDNTWLDFRVDVNAADPDGINSPQSPWLLARMRAPQGIEQTPFAIRLLNTDGAEPGEGVELYLPGYQPVGVDIGDD